VVRGEQRWGNNYFQMIASIFSASNWHHRLRMPVIRPA
jgi:hypothetical protein